MGLVIQMENTLSDINMKDNEKKKLNEIKEKFNTNLFWFCIKFIMKKKKQYSAHIHTHNEIDRAWEWQISKAICQILSNIKILIYLTFETWRRNNKMKQTNTQRKTIFICFLINTTLGLYQVEVSSWQNTLFIFLIPEINSKLW